jgi:hypothetical protein
VDVHCCSTFPRSHLKICENLLYRYGYLPANAY